MNYEACEYMTGAQYNLTPGAINTNVPFKGAFGGFGASTLTVGAGYEITYVMNMSTTLTGNISILTQFGTATFQSSPSITLTTIGSFLITMKLSFQVTAGTATTATLFGWVSVEIHNTNTTITHKAYQVGFGNLAGFTGGDMSPNFFVNTNIAPASWGASRREYTFIRRY